MEMEWPSFRRCVRLTENSRKNSTCLSLSRIQAIRPCLAHPLWQSSSVMSTTTKCKRVPKTSSSTTTWSVIFWGGGYFYNMFWMNCLKLIIFISQTGSGTGYRSGTSVRLRSGRLGFAGQEILLGHERASEFLSPSGHWHVDNAPWNAWRQIPSSFPRLRSQTYSSRCASQCDHHRSRDYPRSCDQFRFHPHSWHFRRRFHPHLGL